MGTQKKQKKTNEAPTKGEGNRQADRNYREEATEFAKSGRVEKAARKAAREIEKSDPKGKHRAN